MQLFLHNSYFTFQKTNFKYKCFLTKPKIIPWSKFAQKNKQCRIVYENICIQSVYIANLDLKSCFTFSYVILYIIIFFIISLMECLIGSFLYPSFFCVVFQSCFRFGQLCFVFGCLFCVLHILFFFLVQATESSLDFISRSRKKPLSVLHSLMVTVSKFTVTSVMTTLSEIFILLGNQNRGGSACGESGVRGAVFFCLGGEFS